MLPKVAVIILNWNGRDDTRRCLESLRKMDYDNHRIILIDNGSTDGSVLEFSTDRELLLVVNSKNAGFTGGMNQGIELGRKLGADCFLLLNNDTVVAPDMLRTLVDAQLKEKKAGILAPAVYHLSRPEIIQSMGGRINWNFGNATLMGMDQRDDGRYTGTYEVDYAHGACIMVPREAMDAVGGYDDDYFAYWDEVDLAVRIRHKGYRVLMVAAAKLYHRGYATAERTQSAFPVYYMTRNRIFFMRKHSPASGRLMFPFVLAKNSIGSAVHYALAGKSDCVKAIFRGLKEGFFSPLSRASR